MLLCFAALPKRRPLAYPCFYAALVCRTAFQKTLDTIKGGALNPSAPPDVAFIHLHNPYILKSFFRGSQLTLFNLFATSCQLNSAFLKKFCFPFNGLPFSPLINSKACVQKLPSHFYESCVWIFCAKEEEKVGIIS